jgi:hypothetical protein
VIGLIARRGARSGAPNFTLWCRSGTQPSTKWSSEASFHDASPCRPDASCGISRRWRLGWTPAGGRPSPGPSPRTFDCGAPARSKAEVGIDERRSRVSSPAQSTIRKAGLVAISGRPLNGGDNQHHHHHLHGRDAAHRPPGRARSTASIWAWRTAPWRRSSAMAAPWSGSSTIWRSRRRMTFRSEGSTSCSQCRA